MSGKAKDLGEPRLISWASARLFVVVFLLMGVTLFVVSLLGVGAPAIAHEGRIDFNVGWLYVATSSVAAAASVLQKWLSDSKRWSEGKYAGENDD